MLEMARLRHCSSQRELETSIKKLCVGKEKDLVKLQVEYLMWGLKTLTPHIIKIFNDILQHEFPKYWTTNLSIPIFTSGDINNPSNYRTIMINSLYAKLFGNMIENRIIKWLKEQEKHAKKKVGFKPKHSIVDHGIILRHIIENVWEEKEEVFCHFVDFKKAFDTFPRDKLWHRMEELGIRMHLRAVVHRPYEEVLGATLVKQGCPLSPHSF